MTRAAFIAAARRTPVAPAGGMLSGLEVHELAAPVMRACLADVACPPGLVDEAILGNALYAGGNPARLATLFAGLPEHVGGLTIDRQCAGGLDALALAAALIESGAADAVLAGGAESHSRRPARMRRSKDGEPPIPYERPPFSPFPDRDPDLHEAAARLAADLGITKERQDRWAVESHSKARQATNRLAQEIAAGPWSETRDPFARTLTMETCRRAPGLAGSVTRANTAVSADAAAFVLVVEERLLGRLAASPAIRIAASRTTGAAPELPGLAPVAAISAVLDEICARPDAVDAAEIMEAYAAQALACIDLACIDPARVNLGGGALARGHPIGASGAVLAVRLFHELVNAGSTGIAAIAAAGGIGTAVCLQR